MLVIGISGKKGSGKNYLSDHLAVALKQHGYTSLEDTFGRYLKEELGDLLTFIRTYNPTPQTLAEHTNTTPEEAQHLLDLLKTDITNPALDGWSRTPSILNALQYWGTNVRRKQQDDYWAAQLATHVTTLNPAPDVVLIPDVRFLNEVKTVEQFNNHLTIRLNVSSATLARRQRNRDGQAYTATQMTHPSETALDDYPNFDITLDEGYDFDLVLQDVLHRL